MGKRGPQQTDTATLERRNSWRAKARKKEAKPQRRLVPVGELRPVDDWKALICSIPGYDPYAQKGDCDFDEALAWDAIEWIEGQLRHVKGPKGRTPFFLEDWERAIVANLFGWKRPDETRRYRKCLIYVPRKNGKTPFAAALILYVLFESGEIGQEIYGAASTYKQACYVFAHARGMVDQNPDLLARCQIFKGQAKSIEMTDDHSIYGVISGEHAATHGGNSNMYAVDELHVLPDSELLDVLETATAGRPDPLAVFLTTADFEREGSPCNEMHDHACKVRDDAVHDPTFLPVIYEASVDDDWTDRELWERVNPNLGVSVTWEYIEAACEKAKRSPRFENTFKRLHLNIRTEQDVRWMALSEWDACDDELPSLEGERCYAGLDMSSTRDITAFVLLFPDCGNAILPFFWVPGPSIIAKEADDAAPYVEWERHGLITSTQSPTTDYDAVRARINELHEIYKIEEIAIDRWNSTQLQKQLCGDGFEIVTFGQGFASMTAPTKELERLVLGREIIHGGNPVLRWMVSNCAVDEDAAENVKLNKKKSSGRIDGIIGLIMALGRVMLAAQDEPYAERGVLTLDTLAT